MYLLYSRTAFSLHCILLVFDCMKEEECNRESDKRTTKKEKRKEEEINAEGGRRRRKHIYKGRDGGQSGWI